MIVERALKELFKNISVEGRATQFNYGTQRELNQWITYQNTNKLVKFPLIWFVCNDYTEFNDTFRIKNARIIVFMNTEYNWLNETRSEKTYEKWIEPIVKDVVKALKKSLYVTIYGKNDFEKFKYRDVRNYGLSLVTKNAQEQPKESVTTDIVDATLIDFDLEIKPICIIKK